jgi:hypothetical protein
VSRAEELLAQYERKINQVGQWVVIRRYTGTAGVRTFTDTAAKGYVLHQMAKEFVGASTQAEMTAIILVDGLSAILPLSTNDRIVSGFYGCDDLAVPPALDESGHISGGKERAIRSVEPRAPGGVLIAIELRAVG